jgi:hypothetical protein
VTTTEIEFSVQKSTVLCKLKLVPEVGQQFFFRATF